MGATVVDDSHLDPSKWTSAKPADYQGKDLDTALKAYQTASKKEIKVLAQLPNLPTVTSLSKLEALAKSLEEAVTVTKKSLTQVKQLSTALGKVSSAASKTSTELKRLAKKKTDSDKSDYTKAADAASSIGAAAANLRLRLR